MLRKIKIVIPIFIFLGIISLGFFGEKGDQNNLRKINGNDDYEFISINQVFMWVSNNGDGSHDPRTDGSGFYWPGGRNATIPAIFEDGLIFGGKIGSEIRVNGNTHRQGLQAGKIKNDGTPDSPSLDKYRVYKIRKDWETYEGDDKEQYIKDYNEWPVEDGAPWVDVDGDNVFTRGVDEPKFVGDEVLWYVANDMDAARSTFTYGTNPMGLEFQTTIFGFNRTGDLGDMVFKKYLIINKGSNTIDSMIVGYWSDTDLGFAGDDYTGCDINLSLGYTWNGDNNDDDAYGPNPPAIGYDFFQGPIVKGNPTDRAKFKGQWRDGYKNLPMTAFAFYINGSDVYRDPRQGNANGSKDFYNYLKGKVWDGQPFIDPWTKQPTKFVLTGDPVAGTGWYEGKGWPGGPAPDDRRHLMASGSFTMAPGDTQEVVVAILIGRGSSNVKSVKELKIKDQAAQFAYDADFNIPPAPPAPKVTTFPEENSVTLWWDANSESYENDFYKFEGYRIWQFRNLKGDDATVLGTFDLANEYGVIEDFVVVNDERVKAPVIAADNSGLIRNFTIEQNKFTNQALIPGTPYYFGVTAYGVAKSASTTPAFLESVPIIMEIFPGRDDIDNNVPTSRGQILEVEQSAGTGDAYSFVEVVDPYSLTGDTYEIVVDSTVVNTSGDKDVSFTIKDKTLNKTISSQSRDFSSTTAGMKVFDGFKLAFQNYGLDSLGSNLSKVENILEINGPNGTPILDPINVYGNLNSTKKWTIIGKGTKGKVSLDPKKLSDDGLRYKVLEIRFTGTSPYYLVGYKTGTPATIFKKDDELATSTLPFQVWDLGDDLNSANDDKRLVIKVHDFYRKGTVTDSTKAIDDKKWTQLANGEWEMLYMFDTTKTCFYDGSGNLPATSGNLVDGDFVLAYFVFKGELPAPGTVLRVNTLKPLSQGDVFTFSTLKANFNDKNLAKKNLDKISVYPNPYFGSNNLETDKYRRFVRFTGLPKEATIRIFSISGVFIQRIDKNDFDQYVDWNLQNESGLPVASGVYIAYIDMPGIGTKTMKLAVILEQQYIDRL